MSKMDLVFVLLMILIVLSTVIFAVVSNIPITIHATPISTDNKTPMYTIDPPVDLKAGKEYIIIFDRPKE